MTRDLGDFQTPAALVDQVLVCCNRDLGPAGWARALEPTCGEGRFIAGLLRMDSPPREIRGIEVQAGRAAGAAAIALGACADARVEIHRANVFDLHFARDIRWQESGSLLVVGNPPWVTNAELGSLGSRNVPRKGNIKALAGIEAITGSANFDLAESIWLKLLGELADDEPTIALLCKTSVARNVLHHAWRRGLPIAGGFIRRIDAGRWFGAAVDACLFAVTLKAGAAIREVPVYADLETTTPEVTIGVHNGRLVADVTGYRSAAFADGVSPFVWRQGVKHDAGALMELAGDPLTNRRGDPVDVEAGFVYPLLKSTDLFHGSRPRRSMIVPQRSLGEDTRSLARTAPGLWRYLTANEAVFRARKSSIYRTQPPFALFGIGDYTFADYKVAVSGLHKEPRFRLVGPEHGRPVVFDDTCYFVPCRSATQAALVCALLNSDPANRLLRSLMFTDAKRPVTKALLQRIDLLALARASDHRTLTSRADVYRRAWPGDEPWPRDLAGLLLADGSPRRQRRRSSG